MSTTHDNLNDLFEDIATSIRAKTGSSATMTAHQMPAQIDSIVTDPSGSCTATDSDILSGKTAYAGGVLRTGNIASYNKGWKDPNVLYFEALESNSTIKLKANTWTSMETSTDNISWTTYTANTEITLANIGDKIYWRGTNLTITDPYSYTGSKGFVMTGKFAAYGNLNRLLSYTEDITDLTGRDSCFVALFNNCASLISVENLRMPATTLSYKCYGYMFSFCGFTTPPVLPATNLAGNCYMYMFCGCSNLISAPELPATTLADSCYSSMFLMCAGLTTPPALPATTLAIQCYTLMFKSCSSLTTPPSLQATTLAINCYRDMFNGCTSLTTPPALPATTLAGACYSYMFEGCTSLNKVPALPALELQALCYQGMFYGCSALRVTNEPYDPRPATTWRVPTSGTFTNTTTYALPYFLAGTYYASELSSVDIAGTTGSYCDYCVNDSPIS